MLAAKRSFGNLRSVARLHVQASSRPAVPLAQAPVASGSRTLMSAVLLSRDQFEKKTVKQLQEELSTRGLSTKGKKSALVDRLVEAASRGGPTASLSTSAVSRAEVVTPTEVKTHAPSALPTDSKAIPTAGEAEPKDAITAAPGLLVNKSEAKAAAETAEEAPGGGIDLPAPVSLPSQTVTIVESEVMIPTLPDQYKNPEDYDPFTQPFTMHPSWLTVSEEKAVHHQGSSTTPIDDPNSRSSEPRKEFEYIPATGLLQDIAADFGIKLQPKSSRGAKAASEASEEAKGVLAMLQNQLDVKVPPLSEPVKGSRNSGKGGFKFEDRQLDSREKTGAWVLSGILAGGLLLGGLGKKSKNTKEVQKEAKH